MVKDVFTFIVGGKAGEGVKKTGAVAAQMFIDMKRQVFQMDDYMSLIRGGHNFSVVSTATRWISNHYMRAELIVNLDERSYDNHKDELADGGILIFNSDVHEASEGIGVPITSEAKGYKNAELMHGLAGVAVLASALGMSQSDLNNIIKQEYPGDNKANIEYAGKIYDRLNPQIGGKFSLDSGDTARPIMTGNEAISMGAIAGGLDIYYGYPMTPASTILHFLADHADEFGLAVIHPESELAVINMAIGSTVTGARAMVGSSGGGVALMSEAFSLAGMSEAPILTVWSVRSGPSTGVPTYTEQADLNYALHIGHGEYPRIVASPSSMVEAFTLTAEMLDLVWKFQTPGILLTEKHLSESRMTVDLDLEAAKWAEPKMHTEGEYKRYLDTDDGISPLLFPPSEELIKWNSYEHDEMGITTEVAEKITKMHDKRYKKQASLETYLKDLTTVNVFGDAGPKIMTYGSTTMSVLEALEYGGMEATVVQPVYLSPLPVWILDDYQDDTIITVEQSLAAQFTTLLKDKVGIKPKATIKKYDGRPFDPIELASKLKVVM